MSASYLGSSSILGAMMARIARKGMFGRIWDFDTASRQFGCKCARTRLAGGPLFCCWRGQGFSELKTTTYARRMIAPVTMQSV